mgnify:CR=1 FL=1
MGSLNEADAVQLLEFSLKFAKLGSHCAAQVAEIVFDARHAASADGVAADTIELARDTFGGMNEGLDDAIANFFARRAVCCPECGGMPTDDIGDCASCVDVFGGGA